MGWFKDLKKKIKKTVKNVGKTFKHIDPIDFVTDPVNTVTKAFPGLGNSLDTMDPMNTMHQGYGVREAERQYEYEKGIAEQNFERQDYWTQKNYEAQMEAFQYQKDLNEKQLLNEADAVQRRVADLKAAGLSPTLAAGSAAGATPVHAGTAPQGVAPQKMTASDVKARAAMFADSQRKDYMQLALSMLGNFADISRTRAETEFIAAQKDKLVGETPVDLEIKKEISRLNEELHSIKVDQAKQNLTNSEADYITKLWSHVAASDEHLIQTTKKLREEVGVKLDEQALRIGETEENIKKTEALIDGIALQLEQIKLDTEKQLKDFYDKLGVPRGVHDKPAYAPFTLIRGLIEGVDKGGRWLFEKASPGLKKIGKLIGSDYSN